MKAIKRIIVIVLAAVGLVASAYGQELKVEFMRMDAMDLTASRYKRLDRNGVACALVKVQVPLEGVVFEGNVMGNVENKAGEYWVYITAGTKFFRIKHKSVTPLDVVLSDYALAAILGRVILLEEFL